MSDAIVPSPPAAPIAAGEPEAAEEPPRPRSRVGVALRIGAVALVIALVVAAWRLGAFEHVRDAQRLKEYMLGLGGAGYVVFVLSFALLQPFGLPGVTFMIAAPLIWPWHIAYALTMTGATLATIVGFSFARFVARDAVAKRIPKRFRKYDQRLAEKAFTTIFLLRTIFWVHPVLHVFFGSSKVSFRTHVVASVAGYTVPLFIVTFFGQRVIDFVTALEGWHWVVAAIVALKIIIVALSVRRWLQKKKAPDSQPSQTSLATGRE
ncbi:MAG: VTT domain-containing protein [Polyangiaceae bacterium]